MDLSQGEINPARKNQFGQVKKRVNGQIVAINLYENPDQDDQDILNALNSLDQTDDYNESYNRSTSIEQDTKENRIIDDALRKAVTFYQTTGVLPVDWKQDHDYVITIAKKVSQKTRFDFNKIIERIR